MVYCLRVVVVGFFFSSRRRHTRCALVTGVQTCALPISAIIPFDSPHHARLRAKAERHAANIVSFGLNEGADVRAVDWLPDGQGGSLVTAEVQEALLCLDRKSTRLNSSH